MLLIFLASIIYLLTRPNTATVWMLSKLSCTPSLRMNVELTCITECTVLTLQCSPEVPSAGREEPVTLSSQHPRSQPLTVLLILRQDFKLPRLALSSLCITNSAWTFTFLSSVPRAAGFTGPWHEVSRILYDSGCALQSFRVVYICFHYRLCLCVKSYASGSGEITGMVIKGRTLPMLLPRSSCPTWVSFSPCVLHFTFTTIPALEEDRPHGYTTPQLPLLSRSILICHKQDQR